MKLNYLFIFFFKKRIIGNLWVKEFLENRRLCCLLMDMGCYTYGLPFALRATASEAATEIYSEQQKKSFFHLLVLQTRGSFYLS